MKTRRKRVFKAQAFVIAELVVVVLVVGLALIPIIRGMMLLPQVGAAVGTQNRSESWRSLSDQAVTAGIDPIATQVLGAVVIEPVPGLHGRLSRTNLAARAGAPQITFLSETFSGIAEARSAGGGFEVGPGIAVAPRADPVPPLVPIKLQKPSLNPADGIYVALLALAPPATKGDPYTGNIRATGASISDFIRLEITEPSKRKNGSLGFSDISVSAPELAHGVKGTAWAEYNGNPSTDVPAVLDDHRVVWFVRDQYSGRIQSYEPSDVAELNLGVSIGSPVYSVAGKEYTWEQTVEVDFVTALNIGNGAASALFVYPQAVRECFGNEWASVEPSYSWHWTFDGVVPGDSSGGNTIAGYKPAGRLLWGSTQTVIATPITPLLGLEVLGATWTLKQVPTVLLPPERVSDFYDPETSTDVGPIDFRVPVLPGTSPEKRFGRPSANGVEGVSDTITVKTNE